MSKIYLITVTATVIFTIGLVSISSAQEETVCKGVALNMTGDQKTMITDCLTESNIKSVWKIPLEKLSCFGVCILKKKELLTADGRLDHDKIFSYIEDVMKPDEVKKPIKEGVDKCFKEHSHKVKDDGDPKCLSFQEVGLCVHDIFLENCLD